MVVQMDANIQKKLAILKTNAGLKPKNFAKARVIDAAAVVGAFNSWSFKREQPDSAEKMRVVAQRSIEMNAPIPFVLYWGKGPRVEIASPDLQCLRYLATLADRVKAAYAPGVEISLIFTDTHAALNGHPSEKAEAYFNAVREAAVGFGFKTTTLSDLVSRLAETDSVEDVSPDAETLRKLNACAAKWYRGDGGSETGARRYFQANMIERRAVEQAFPHSIFVTFNSSEFRELFPATLPVFYMYSLKKGNSVKPWFIEAREEPAAETAPLCA
jgi:hypothetical protein